MGKNIIKLTENDIRKIVKGSVNKILKEALDEMPTGKKIQFRDDKRDVWHKFSSRIRNKNFGLCKSDQRQLGMMYAEANYGDREDLAERIYDYACKKQWEYGRMKSNGDEELCERLDMEMMGAFSQGEREYDNSDIWTDDDPNFNGPDGYETSTYQLENKSHLNKVIKEATNEIRNDKNSGHISFGDEEENDWTGIGVDEDLQRIHYIALGIINNSKDRYYRGINHKPSKRDIEAANNILNITRQAGCTNASIKNVRY